MVYITDCGTRQLKMDHIQQNKYLRSPIGLIGMSNTINDNLFNYMIKDFINTLKTNPKKHNTPIFINGISPWIRQINFEDISILIERGSKRKKILFLKEWLKRIALTKKSWSFSDSDLDYFDQLARQYCVLIFHQNILIFIKINNH